jgi:endonuclease-3
MKNFDEIVERVIEQYPKPMLELNFTNPFELLVSLVLSARCTDKLTNKITEELFDKYPTPKEMSQASFEQINEIISSCSMHNTKAKNLKAISEILCEKYSCNVPNKFDELVSLPGVADKTANIVLSFGFGIPAIGVDTHVLRAANRLGISSSKKPKQVEEDIKNICPKEKWIAFYAGLILLGRHICKAKKPSCESCFLNDICPKNGLR